MSKTPQLVEFFAIKDSKGELSIIDKLKMEDILQSISSMHYRQEGKLIIKVEKTKYQELVRDLQLFQNRLSNIAANTTVLKTLQAKKESVEKPLARCIDA